LEKTIWQKIEPEITLFGLGHSPLHFPSAHRPKKKKTYFNNEKKEKSSLRKKINDKDKKIDIAQHRISGYTLFK